MPVSATRNKYLKFSKQPRFSGRNGKDEEIFFSIVRLVNETASVEPSQESDNRVRDAWLREFVKKEPNLMGVVNTVVDIDKNRGWRMIGGRNQVLKFTRAFHNFAAAPGLVGWRPGISVSSQAFWGTDIGAITELGRDGQDGPVEALYFVDPVKCALTGDDQFPLKYYRNSLGKPVKWSWKDFVRTASMNSMQDDLNGLGYCAVSRCLELVRLMIAVYEHDKEQLGAKAPKGVLTIKGISQNQWDTALEIREAKQQSKEIDYFSDVMTIASRADIDMKLVALSNLPVSFNLREWMDMIMFGYALIFGFDPSEFWPVQFGALGRGTETEIQHEKATGKGRLDYVLTFQEQIQEFLPDTVEFAFDQRDEKGDLLHAQVNQSWSNVAKTLYEAGASNSEGSLLSKAQSMMILADHGVIPRTWVPTETAETTDTDDSQDSELTEDVEEEPEVNETPPSADEVKPTVKTRRLKNLLEEYRDKAYIYRAAQEFPNEPIVQYSWPANTLIELWESGETVYARKFWNGIDF